MSSPASTTGASGSSSPEKTPNKEFPLSFRLALPGENMPLVFAHAQLELRKRRIALQLALDKSAGGAEKSAGGASKRQRVG